MYYGNVTFVIALPRSRTAWIAQTFDPSMRTVHDPLKRCESIAELQKGVDEMNYDAGFDPQPIVVVDTAAMFFYPEIATRFPGARYMFIRRQPQDVMHSLAKAGQPTHGIAEANKYYNAARSMVNVDKRMSMIVQYEDLNDERVLHNMWRFFGCLHEPAPGYFANMVLTNIQIPFDVQQRNTNVAKVSKLFAHRRSWL